MSNMCYSDIEELRHLLHFYPYQMISLLKPHFVQFKTYTFGDLSIVNPHPWNF